MTALWINVALGQPQQFNIDKAHSHIEFEVSHMVISEVNGEFHDYEVNLMFDANDVTNSSVETRIKVASIDTDQEKRDNHLRSSDFFDAETHPEIVFKSKKIEKSSDEYIAHGDLTIRGVTKEVALPFKVKGPIKDSYGNTRIGVEASLTINRQDYGVSWSKTLDGGGLVAGNEVKIGIQAEFTAAQ
jgi:polyisoprenoid-binding protein YceI